MNRNVGKRGGVSEGSNGVEIPRLGGRTDPGRWVVVVFVDLIRRHGYRYVGSWCERYLLDDGAAQMQGPQNCSPLRTYLTTRYICHEDTKRLPELQLEHVKLLYFPYQD
jgi:hypothetical protein